MKRREAKSKGEKERYIHLNAKFQRIARKDKRLLRSLSLKRLKRSLRGKKDFLSDQCKEIEENNRMGKTRDLFKTLEIPREHLMHIWAQ